MKKGGEMVEIQFPIPRVVKAMAACDDHDPLVEELIK